MALVCSEIDTAKVFKRSLSSFWAEILPHFTLRLKEYPTPHYADRGFDQLRLDFLEVGGYSPASGTLN